MSTQMSSSRKPCWRSRSTSARAHSAGRWVIFFQAFYNVARPHMSLRQPLPLQECERHGAIRPRWRECTPALATGLTDHVWTFRELLTAKFEPLDSQSISG